MLCGWQCSLNACHSVWDNAKLLKRLTRDNLNLTVAVAICKTEPKSHLTACVRRRAPADQKQTHGSRNCHRTQLHSCTVTPHTHTHGRRSTRQDTNKVKPNTETKTKNVPGSSGPAKAMQLQTMLKAVTNNQMVAIGQHRAIQRLVMASTSTLFSPSSSKQPRHTCPAHCLKPL